MCCHPWPKFTVVKRAGSTCEVVAHGAGGAGGRAAGGGAKKAGVRLAG